jgi:hypothetical protein
MTLQIIGSGFGRTGTRSLKDALEILGFAPCHHMDEVFAHPEQVALWQAYVAGQEPDWTQAFAGYRAQIDWPGCHVWRELATTFPNARIVHSQREPEAWWASFSATIGKLMTEYQSLDGAPHTRAMRAVVAEIVGQRTFGGRWTEKEVALAAYHARRVEVQAAIPADRLLVYDVAQGWAPLCAFLHVPVPDQPFPRRNDSGDFWQNVAANSAAGSV